MITTVVFLSPYVLWGMRTRTCCVFVYLLLHRIPSECRAILYIVEKVSRRSQRSWNRVKRFSIHGEIMEICWQVWTLRGGITPSFLYRPPRSLSVDGRPPRMLPWTLTKGEWIVPLKINIEIQRKLGHDKAAPCFSYISPSTLGILDRFGTYRKVFSSRIQLYWLQEVWRRTRWGSWILPGNELIGTDKEY